MYLPISVPCGVTVDANRMAASNSLATVQS